MAPLKTWRYWSAPAPNSDDIEVNELTRFVELSKATSEPTNIVESSVTIKTFSAETLATRIYDDAALTTHAARWFILLRYPANADILKTNLMFKVYVWGLGVTN